MLSYLLWIFHNYIFIFNTYIHFAKLEFHVTKLKWEACIIRTSHTDTSPTPGIVCFEPWSVWLDGINLHM